MATLTSGDLSSGASVATGYTNQPGMTITRGDIVGPATKASVTNIEASDEIQHYSFPHDLKLNYMTIGVSYEEKRTSMATSWPSYTHNISKTSTYIRLPLPSNIADHTDIGYNEAKTLGLSTVSGAIMSGLNRLLPDFLRSTASTIENDAYNEILARNGVAPNQMFTVMLTGPRYKRHAFEWTLYPKNKKESDTIRKIISKLKSEARPGLDPTRQFFTFPSVFNLSFALNNVDLLDEGSINNYLFSFKPAVLTSIDVNYTPAGQPSLYKTTGAPNGVTIRLSFLELEYWLSKDMSSEGSMPEVNAAGDVVWPTN